MADRDYSAADRAIIARKQREIDNLKAKREAAINSIKKGYKGVFKNPRTKNRLAKEFLDGMNGKLGNNKLDFKAPWGGTGEITGFEELPWENDDDFRDDPFDDDDDFNPTY